MVIQQRRNNVCTIYIDIERGYIKQSIYTTKKKQYFILNRKYETIILFV